jgi:hypothetical protein
MRWKNPAAGEIEFLHSMLHRPVLHPDAIGWGHCCFLTALISVLAPRRVIEIGTLTGVFGGGHRSRALAGGTGTTGAPGSTPSTFAWSV